LIIGSYKTAEVKSLLEQVKQLQEKNEELSMRLSDLSE
jgi:cell division protein FtsB